ncbi:hypothetical protein [Pelomonas sp. SE-A7]|uniref:hypothetical protein n=1 Tax=Pelomonas sp. SE-A7 TaxID=3054953 RepID=UPI00259C837B|nr:hypothetical protein [Pelomonas sp. SE-A7]MDM4766104.1 hypothetical protein [Pelomonas sp. SE-A7]
MKFPSAPSPALRLSLIVSLLLAATASQAEIPLQFSGGADRWSQRVSEQWLPRSKQALDSLEAFAQAQYGIKLDGRLSLLMLSTPTAAVPIQAGAAGQLKVEAGLAEAELRRRALLQPLRQGMGLVVEELTAGEAKRLPAWLSTGLADLVARQLVAALNLPTLPSYAAEPPIHRPEGADAAKSAKLVQGQQTLRAAQRLSLSLVEALQQRLGADFHPRMKAYLQAAGRHGFDAEAAFSQQFGLSQAELIAVVEKQQAERPEADAVAEAAAASPNAIQVKMGGYVKDEFALQVERDWLGVVRQASAQFDRLVNDTLKVGLVRGARIYVGGGLQDYETILREDMRMPVERAELQGEVSGGLSNSKGQIALKFTPRQNRAAAYDVAVKTTLHELTHELQKQLDNNHAGFRPPVWLREGTADLMAYMLAPQVRVTDVETEVMRSWRDRNLNWWRTGNKTSLQPEELATVSPNGWTQMMKEKRGNYQMAGLMSMYLQAITGERFLPAWVEYYKLAGQKQPGAAASFQQAFGLSESEFQADFRRWLVQQ